MNNLTQPAYPVVPLQDNFKRLVVPIPGLSKLEHFALELYKSYKNNNDENEIAILNQEEHNENENGRANIKYICWYPNISASSSPEGDNLHHPRYAHQQE